MIFAHSVEKQRNIGVSSFAAWQVIKAQAATQSIGTGILQPMYSLVKHQAEMALFPVALAEGIEVAPYRLISAKPSLLLNWSVTISRRAVDKIS